MKTVYLIIIATLFSFCQTQDMHIKDPSEIRFDVQGYVEDVRIDSEGAFINILVNGQMNNHDGQTMIDYGWATVTTDTIIYVNGERVDFYPFEIDRSIKVLVQYEGAILESYPVQGTASFVSVKTDD